MAAENELIGRERDLAAIRDIWEQVRAGTPRLLVLRADAGVGKTRLVQEFFRRLSVSVDPDAYWPDELPDTRDGMTIVPPPSPRSIAETPPVPWLWLAVRCRDETGRNYEGRGDVAFDGIRRQLAIHLAGLYGAEVRRTGNVALAKGTFGVLASFALPGSGPVIEGISQAIAASSQGVTGWDMVKAARERLGSRRAEIDISLEAAERDAASLEAEATKAFRALADPGDRRAPSVPIVLVVDDAHWADETTVRVVERLLSAARAESWPLLIVATAWDETLTRQELKANQRYTFGSFLERTNERDETSVCEFELERLRLPQLKRLIEQEFPVGETAAEIIAGRADGDLDVLFDYLEVLRCEPGWVDAAGNLLVPVAELQRLPTRAIDVARRRLRVLEQDTQVVLAWAAAQGLRFHGGIVERLMTAVGGRGDFVATELLRSDREFAVTKVEPHPTLQLSGEFRRPAYHAVATEWLERLADPEAVRAVLAASLREVLVDETHWSALEVSDRARISRRLLGLADVLDSEDHERTEVLGTVRLELARAHQMMGDASGAAEAAGQLVHHAVSSIHHRLVGRRIIVQSAYMDGDLEKERRELASWRASEGESAELLLRESSLAMRSSGPTAGAAACRKVLERYSGSGSNEREVVEASTTFAMAMWSQGTPEEGLAVLRECEADQVEALDRSAELRASLDHSAALILHDLERNLQVTEYADACVQAYEALGHVESAVISRVNLGDAWWGAGRPDLARRILETAYRDAVDSSLPHAQDIAAICYANVLASIGEHEAAASLYDEGIELADRIGHDWDLLYGRIYRRLFVAEVQRDDPDATRDLLRLADEAGASGYHYLEWLGRSYAVLAAIATSDFGEAARLVQEARRGIRVATPPGPRAYLAAADIVTLEEGAVGRSQAEGLLAALGRCEGIKGRPYVVSAALDRLSETHLLRAERAFVDRWRARFIEVADHEGGALCLRRCDYRACEARCCYDGVYLDADEVKTITQAVIEHAGFFSHLPKKYIVHGEWEGTSGPKTAVRPHEYRSPDFPDHFASTRCVFALEDGACSLQALGEAKGTHPWQFKPRGCWIHPLSIDNGEVSPPSAPGERDASFAGTSYPGYASFTPCGQHRADGQPWKSALREEVDALSRLKLDRRAPVEKNPAEDNRERDA